MNKKSVVLLLSIISSNIACMKRTIDEVSATSNNTITNISIDTINAKDEHGRTMLHLFASNNSSILVETLLNKGADINARDASGATPLHFAVLSGNIDIAKLLIFKGAKVNQVDNNANTALDYAIYKNNIGMVKLLLKFGGPKYRPDDSLHILEEIRELINSTKSIFDLIEENNVEEVKLLLDNGVNIDIRDSEDYTPLHIAVARVKTDMVIFLLENGANINAKNGYGHTPLHLASQHYQSGSEYLNLDRIELFKTVNLLILKGADVNAKNAHTGKTPIYEAILHRNKDIVKILLDNGAIIIAKDDLGNTPLHEAAMNTNEELTKLLLTLGADINAQNHSHGTPLHLALKDYETTINNLDVIKLLVKAGANVNVKNNKGRTPLFLASMLACKEGIEILLANRADKSIKDNFGKTASEASLTDDEDSDSYDIPMDCLDENGDWIDRETITNLINKDPNMNLTLR